jgi:hypothetical protein
MNRMTGILFTLLSLALLPKAAAADTQWVLQESTLIYHVSHPLHQTEGVSHAARAKSVCREGNAISSSQFPSSRSILAIVIATFT